MSASDIMFEKAKAEAVFNEQKLKELLAKEDVTNPTEKLQWAHDLLDTCFNSMWARLDQEVIDNTDISINQQPELFVEGLLTWCPDFYYRPDVMALRKKHMRELYDMLSTEEKLKIVDDCNKQVSWM